MHDFCTRDEFFLSCHATLHNFGERCGLDAIEHGKSAKILFIPSVL